MGKVPMEEVSQAEREEIVALLASRILARSPRILRFAEYIGRKYLDGEADTLKEYSIATEALGKAEDFDPKHDSIVRVEAHRLRRKLAEYYATEGAANALRMVLDPGHYVPRFVPNCAASPGALAETEASAPAVSAEEPPVSTDEATPDLAVSADPVVTPAAVPVVSRMPRRTLWLWSAAALIALAAASAGVIGLARNPSSFRILRARPSGTAVEIRCLAGASGGPYAGALGEAWPPEQWFSGGRRVIVPNRPIPRDTGIPVNTQRQGDFNYDIPLTGATYELRLYFAPRSLPDGSATDPVSTRRFNVLANGRKILDALDPSAARPLDRWVTSVFRDVKAAADGKLHLAFRSGLDTAYVNAIQLTPGEKGRMLPVRIVAKSSAYSEPNGRLWSPDRYASAGRLATRTRPVKNTPDPNLFSGERFGTFTYEIPVASGRYGLRLYFAETWFGEGVGGGGAGSRRFDVNANGTPLLRDFDLFREAGGNYRALVKTFHGLTPDAEGYINLAFIPRVNHASINALELFDESR